ncbi:MAG: hypothetical protein CFE44_06215 [Burkholderiales bacterium PBB4]|nr:MAG: hypothetical protein CFE44_06215 [Burkholderiales bacterium PBB4]
MYSTFVALCVALGIGLLVGAERERRKSDSPQRSAARICTFAIASVMGTVTMIAGGLADAHASAASTASLIASGEIQSS